MGKSQIKHLNSGIIEITVTGIKGYVRLQETSDHVYCAITTFVDPEHRDHGAGAKLYEAVIEFVRKENAKFSATCPYIVCKADEDKSIKDIYVPKTVTPTN
ncbi:MAG: GNAT family N-acetyltransferase [Mycoplasmataceae bacterium]|jgi:predicted GNAT family acetyltransferase|nr:GNAT family N-acetyltransferase [Mycoplasmataceae bacterium]